MPHLPRLLEIRARHGSDPVVRGHVEKCIQLYFRVQASNDMPDRNLLTDEIAEMTSWLQRNLVRR
jgi:hypothetical protein